MNFVGQLRIFRIQPRKIGFYRIDFSLCAPHGQIAMRAEDIVDHQNQDEQAKNPPAILMP